jgi:hypothetical protein
VQKQHAFYLMQSFLGFVLQPLQETSAAVTVNLPLQEERPKVPYFIAAAPSSIL